MSDPTTRKCHTCGAEYELNEARVVRALTGSSREMVQQETARLCWVCARLYHSVRQEVVNDACPGEQV